MNSDFFFFPDFLTLSGIFSSLEAANVPSGVYCIFFHLNLVARPASRSQWYELPSLTCLPRQDPQSVRLQRPCFFCRITIKREEPFVAQRTAAGCS